VIQVISSEELFKLKRSVQTFNVSNLHPNQYSFFIIVHLIQSITLMFSFDDHINLILILSVLMQFTKSVVLSNWYFILPHLRSVIIPLLVLSSPHRMEKIDLLSQ
jgi:hypothetical protein